MQRDTWGIEEHIECMVGGFAGTVSGIVPFDMLDDFKRRIEDVVGKDSCHILSIRPVGGCELKLMNINRLNRFRNEPIYFLLYIILYWIKFFDIDNGRYKR